MRTSYDLPGHVLGFVGRRGDPRPPRRVKVARSRLLPFLAILLTAAPAARATVPRRLIVFHTNDVHGGVQKGEARFINQEFPPGLNNLQGLVTLVKATRQQAEEDGAAVLVLDSGDWFQGPPIGGMSQGRAVMDVFNVLRYDAITIGNHEFDLGRDVLLKLIDGADFPVLGANCIDEETNAPWGGLKPYIIKTYGDLQVAIIGLITPSMPRLVAEGNIKGLRWTDPKVLLPALVDQVRDQGADIVIVCSHIGHEKEWELMESVGGVDLWLGGHSHFGFTRPVEDPYHHTLYSQTYGNGTSVGRWELEISSRTRRLSGYTYEILTLFEDDWEADPKTQTMVARYEAEIEKDMKNVVATAAVPLTRGYSGESDLGNLFCDAQREFAKTDVALLNSGSLRANIPEGEITARDIFTVMPFENTVVVVEMSGADLREVMEISVKGERGVHQMSGASLLYDPTRPSGNRVLELLVGGLPVDPKKRYSVAISDYMFQTRRLGAVTDRVAPRYTGKSVREMLTEYLRAHSPVSAKVEGRIRVKR